MRRALKYALIVHALVSLPLALGSQQAPPKTKVPAKPPVSRQVPATVRTKSRLPAVTPARTRTPAKVPARSRSAVPALLATRVIILESGSTPAASTLIAAFQQRIEQLGRRATITVVQVDGAAGRPAALRTQVDLIIALGSVATTVAATDYRDVPAIGALLARETAASTGRAASNVLLEFPLDVELEYMHRILPDARRIGVLYSTSENARFVQVAQVAAKSIGLELVARRVTSAAQIPAELRALAGNTDVLWGIPDEVVLTPETARAVILTSMRSRLPFVGLSSQWVKAGAIYALERDYADLGAQTAELAIRLLARPASRVNETVRPRKVLYSLNVRSAELMKVALDESLVRGASEVIK